MRCLPSNAAAAKNGIPFEKATRKKKIRVGNFFFVIFLKGRQSSSSRQLSRVPPDKTQQEHNLFPQNLKIT